LKCIESEDEPATIGKEEFLQLSCFISTDVKHMYFGLRNKMQEQITKMSPTLGRNAIYTKTVNFLIFERAIQQKNYLSTINSFNI